MSDYIHRLTELNELREKGVITQEEFDKEKTKILSEGDSPVVYMSEPPPKPQVIQPTQVTVVQNNNGCLKAILAIAAILFVLYVIGTLSR